MHLEVVLVVEIFWKFEASTMNRRENKKLEIVEKNKKKIQKGLPMKFEDLYKYISENNCSTTSEGLILNNITSYINVDIWRDKIFHVI